MKQAHWVILIITIAIAIRVLFYINYPAYQTSGDSVTYYLTGRTMMTSHVFVDQWRTPLYPIIMAIPYFLQGKPMPETFPLLSYEFLAIRLVQAVAGVATVIVMFYLLRHMGIPQWGAGLYCIFLACDRTLLVFEHQLLTESFSTLLLVVTVYLLVRLIRTFDVMTFICLSLLCVVGVFIRPSMMALPFVFVGILLWQIRRKVVWVAGLISILAYIVILLIYAQANVKYFQYRGISRISDVNMLGKILTLRLPIEHTADVGGVKQIIREYERDYTDTNPWQVFMRFPQLFETAYLNSLGSFVHAVIRDTTPAYLVRSTFQIPAAIVSVSDENEVTYTTKRFEFLFQFLNEAYHNSQYMLLLILVAGPVYILQACIRRSVHNTYLLIFSLVSLYHIVFAVYLGYADYARHLSVAYPLMYMLVFIFLYDVWKRLRKISL